MNGVIPWLLEWMKERGLNPGALKSRKKLTDDPDFLWSCLTYIKYIYNIIYKYVCISIIRRPPVNRSHFFDFPVAWQGLAGLFYYTSYFPTDF